MKQGTKRISTHLSCHNGAYYFMCMVVQMIGLELREQGTGNDTRDTSIFLTAMYFYFLSSSTYLDTSYHISTTYNTNNSVSVIWR